MYRKVHGSATFASTDLSKRDGRPPMTHPSCHVLSSLFSSPASFLFRFIPAPSFFPACPHTFSSYIPPLEDTHIYGCFLKRRVVGCHGAPHCPKLPFSSPLSDPREDKGLSIHTTIDSTPPSRKHSVSQFLYISHFTHFGLFFGPLLWIFAFLYVALVSGRSSFNLRLLLSVLVEMIPTVST